MALENKLKEIIEEVGLQKEDIVDIYFKGLQDIFWIYFKAIRDDNIWELCVFLHGDERTYLIQLGEGFERQIDPRDKKGSILIRPGVVDEEGNQYVALIAPEGAVVVEEIGGVSDFFSEVVDKMKEKDLIIKQD